MRKLAVGRAHLAALVGAVTPSGLRRTAWKAIALLLTLLLAGGGAPSSLQLRAATIKAAAALPDFSFAAWELRAFVQMFGAGEQNRLNRLSEDEQVELVRAYMKRRQRIEELEDELSQIVALTLQDGTASQAEPRRELAVLHGKQEARRPLVEAILERQVHAELIDAGLDMRGIVWPPVSFTFIEPPLKLTVSPRERIATVHSRVLQTDFDPVTLAERERAIEESSNLSAHISRIGGMAVYPAIVVEQSSLAWVLSTIAHEWTHHYLFLFPLGLRYATNDELTTINETVSDILGDEIGERLAHRYYPEAVPQPPAGPGAAAEEDCACNTFELWTNALEAEQQRWERPGRPFRFDFRREMRETRLHVDALLEAGLVETAEAYMEARRRFFVAQGYPLRVLNQAYFAFNGSYATGAASSSPIGPQLQRLRAESDDLAHFLTTVRWFTSVGDLEEALRPPE